MSLEPSFPSIQAADADREQCYAGQLLSCRSEQAAGTTASNTEPSPQTDHLEVGHSAAWAGGYAPPLLPLRDRDLQALTELFQQDEITAIEADVLDNLQRRLPEPCWEEPDIHLEDLL
jgi:hypothetical protein